MAIYLAEWSTKRRKKMPVILLLGQQLRDQPLWEQITKGLGLGDLATDA